MDCGGYIVNIAVYIAISMFNDGASAFLELIKNFEIVPGKNAAAHAAKLDGRRFCSADSKAKYDTKAARSERRKARHGLSDDSYLPGGH